MPELRVATFNVHHCEGLDGRVDVGRVAEVIRSTGAALIALQELDRGLVRSGEIDQPAELARLLDMEVAFFPSLRREGGDYGLALLGRPAVSEPAYVPLPRLGTEEPRGAVTATWERLALVSTHLSTYATTRRIQTSALGAIAGGTEGACLVLGDLNQSGRSLGALTSRGFTGAFGHRTLPRTRLRRQIDHILVRGAVMERSWTVPTDASDHLPLVADLLI